MLDISGAYFDACSALGSPVPSAPSEHSTTRKPSKFRSEADGIYSEIHSVRQLLESNYDAYTNFGIYPDVANLDDSQRDALDDQVSDRLDGLKSKLDRLHGKVASNGGMEEGSYAQFQQAVIALMAESFQQVNRLSGQMQMVRMRRTLAARPALCAVENQAGIGGIANKFGVSGQEEQDDTGDMLSEEQRDEFELENAELQTRLNEDLLGAKKAEQQLAEFSQLLSLFNEKVMEQSEIIENIYDNTSTSVESVERGNKELQKTDERMKNDFQVLFAFLIASVILLFYDS